ncbi:phage/plasmid primase, P4 family [Micromonospora okii]|uniref:phage/plasmid primase, P4 family n=1 Tax=Micromonospora okii TaxID=1182970 RepID=UPI001E5241EB|nr:phage/plasmid primase, P4 family [Micromonospora okii]
MKLTDLLARLDAVDDADGWIARCPAHRDSRPSLRIAVGETGAVLLKCRAGCPTAPAQRADDRPGVLDALGMTWAQLDAIDTADAPARARSTSRPADPSAVAALAAQLDGWASALTTRAADGQVYACGQAGGAAQIYAADRFGLDAGDCARLGLGLALDLGGGPRLVVPFRDRDGVPRGYQARALDPAARVRWLGPPSPDGASWAKVGWLPGEAGWSEVIVTEGPGDGLTACATGYDAAPVRGAGQAPAAVAAELVALAAGRPFVVVGDADPAGDRFARGLVAELARCGESARAVRPPIDGDDLTEWRKRNKEGFATEFVRAVVTSEDPGALRARLDAWTDADLTEVASARRLREHFEASGSGVRYSPEAGFFILTAGVWTLDSLDLVRTTAQDVAAALWEEASALADALKEVAQAGDKAATKELGARVGKLKAFARAANSSRGIDAMVKELRALRGVAHDINEFDSHHHLLACRNGVIDLRTGKLLPHDPDLLLTKRVDIEYDPEAQAPRWEKFLREVFPANPDLPAYMQRLTGYGITGETSEQCFAVFFGKGRNGKGVFTEVLAHLFKAHTVATPFSTFEAKPAGGIPNDIAAMKGARLVLASEGEAGAPMAESLLKRVTGQDTISARFMRKEFFEFLPTFLIMLSTNNKPNFKGQDEGLWARVKLIPWVRYFAPHERDRKLKHKLITEEAAGILAWAVRGAVDWYRDGLQDPPSVIAATAEYRYTSDALAGLFPGVFVFEEGARVQARIAWDAYRQWCEDEALPAKERWTRRAFFAALEERKATKKRMNTGVVFEGIRLARPTDRAADVEEADGETREEKSAEARTNPDPLAHKPGVSIPTAGPSLDDVF